MYARELSQSATRWVGWALSSVVLTLLWVTTAWAGAGPPPSDILTIVQDGGVPSVFLVRESQEPPSGATGTLLSFNGVSPTGNPSQYGSYTVLTEPDGTISDVFGVIPVNNNPAALLGDPPIAVNFAVFSDGEIGLRTVPSEFINPNGGTPITLPEGNGGPFAITAYLSPTLQDEGFTGTFRSDAEPAPEPATLALLGVGLAGLGFSRRSRKQ